MGESPDFPSIPVEDRVMVSSVMESANGVAQASGGRKPTESTPYVEQASGGRKPTELAPHELLQRLPPSGRDFEVFEHVVTDGGTTRSAAHEFKISQTRVCQIMERVRAWMDEVSPAPADEQETKKQLQLAEGLAADRLDSLYSQAMTGWRSSEGEVERVRIGAWGEKLTTRTTSHGDPRYLTVAARLALMRSKIASLGALDHAIVAAADLEDETEEAQTPAEVDSTPLSPCGRGAGGEGSSGEPIDHPVRACSANAEFGVRNAESPATNGVATRPAAKSSDPLTRQQAAARRAFFGPVQDGKLNVPAVRRSREREKESVVACVPK
jgi:hypothetical protein